MISIPVGHYFEVMINWLTNNWSGFFKGVEAFVDGLIDFFEAILTFPHALVMVVLFTALAWWATGWKKYGLALFSVIGFVLIMGMGLWTRTMQTLALVLVSTLMALFIGIPLGIWSGRRRGVERVVRPILDFMQTMPAFVYLIPAVFFFRIGVVSAMIATVVFSMPPVIRLTGLGIRQVSKEVVEAATSFGANEWQKLTKVQLPLAKPTIMAGINQCIMLALSMVVIAAMIGAKGLGASVLRGIQRLDIGGGFASGLAVVILAIILDRVTQSNKEKKLAGE